ncbi:MAG: methyltransferase [Bacteriovoracaceae bacterium]
MKESDILVKKIYGYYITQCIGVAAELGLADILGDKTLSVKELASESIVNEDALYRMLRLLCSEDIFVEVKDRHFSNSNISKYLKKDHETSLNGLARLHCDKLWWNSWGELRFSIKENKPSTDFVFKKGAFQVMKENKEINDIFNFAMTNLSSRDARAVTKVFDFTKFKNVIDIGGGEGALINGIKNQLSGFKIDFALFDQGHVIKKVTLTDINLEFGDFFQSVPKGYDCYILRHILHDWSDERCETILKNCVEGMKPNSTLLVIELLLEKGKESSIAKYRDMNMLVSMHGGKERYISEYEKLFLSAGVKLVEVIPLPGQMNILVGKRL